MDRFHALTAFARVVEAGSFARAAERLGVSVSAVSRQVAELEAHLGVRLLNRTTRRLSLTESGQAFYERCVQLLADLEEAEVAVTSASVVPRGTLQLTSSATFGARHLAPAIAAFVARHPQMRFDVELSERVVDIVEEGFDLAVRIGTPGSQNLVARKIGSGAHSLLRRAVLSRAPRRAARTRRPREARVPFLRVPAEPERVDVPRSCGRSSAACGSPDRSTRTTAASWKPSRQTAPASRCEPDFIVRSRRARRPIEAYPHEIRAAAAADLRRLSEPAASVGEGADVRGIPGRALRCSELGDRMKSMLLHLMVATALAASTGASVADPAKILRVASADIETLDPHQYNDSPSFDVISAIFEGLYEWDYLASPAKLNPVGAVALPEVTDSGKTWTIRVRPGVLFTPDPAFAGKPREATAEDYVYSLKRWLDPNLRRWGDAIVTDLIVGARPVVDAAKQAGVAMDYDHPIAGLRALDRYTIQLKLTQPNYPTVEQVLTTCVIAREVVAAAGRDIRTRPVGTGPYRLKEWKRGSRVVLEANPAYRAVRFPESSDPALAPMIKTMRGRALPQVGVVEINVIEEDVTRLLEFERGRLDFVDLRGEIASRMLVGGKLKPEYAARGIQRLVFPEPYLFTITLNVADPTLGGMGNDRVALAARDRARL